MVARQLGSEPWDLLTFAYFQISLPLSHSGSPKNTLLARIVAF
jgi:hypothetical protein